MKDNRELQFKNIQKVVDNCIWHDYKQLIDALRLKDEYLSQAQWKDYLRQEIFRVTETLVKLRQEYHCLHSIYMDMDAHDFLWESSFFEQLQPSERKLYLDFDCGTFNMDEYLKCSTAYDALLPYFSDIVRLVSLTRYLNDLQAEEEKTTTQFENVPAKREEEPQEPKPEEAEPTVIKVVGKSNPFQANFSTSQLKTLADCINEAHIFTTSVTVPIVRNFFACKLDGALKSNNNRLFAYFMSQLGCAEFITYEWQSVIAGNSLVLGKLKGEPLKRTDLSTANDKLYEPKGHEIIDKYIKQLKKG
mgnify:CR=1 FL=1